jgi:hypothetical protein
MPNKVEIRNDNDNDNNEDERESRLPPDLFRPPIGRHTKEFPTQSNRMRARIPIRPIENIDPNEYGSVLTAEVVPA